MALVQVEGPLGAPWERPLAGRFESLAVESELLRSNPLGDSARRPLYVYCAPGLTGGDRVPSVYLLQGYSGQLDNWLARKAFEPNIVERLDRMFAAGDCPPAVIVFVDAWTSLGGAQFINSAGTGRYMDYLCDEVVPFVDGSYPTSVRRGVAGHSSGGYGAMVSSMLRPEVFCAFASHAGDALFESCYMRDFPTVARVLRDHFEGSFDVLLERVAEAEVFDWSRFGAALSIYAMAAAYSPGQVPLDLETGRVIDEVWQQWLRWDPVRMASEHADALRAMRRIYLDAGRQDEFFLDLGAQAFSAELTRLGVEHTLELFDGGHGGLSYRYPISVAELVRALY
jgi:enterochelin esterase-like enzyme